MWKEWFGYEGNDKIGKHECDILVPTIKLDGIFDLRKKLGTVIEILEDKVSSTYVYDIMNNLTVRKYNVIFIINILVYEHKFYKVKLHSKDKYIINLITDTTGIHRCLDLPSKCNMLLDLGDKNLYYIKHVNLNLLEVDKISKKEFVRLMSGRNIKLDIPDKKYRLVDKSLRNKEEIDYCLELMNTKLPSLNQKSEEGDNGYVILGMILAKLSYKDRYIMNTWLRWVFKEDSKYSNLVTMVEKIAPHIITPPDVYKEVLIDKYNSEHSYDLDYFKKIYV